ncbi:MAG: helix-turn-helix domain-containing protein [Acidobacteria bacterium]|nr:helix-turn-helix domain-containing protein [Acidobacteriota bacterium]
MLDVAWLTRAQAAARVQLSERTLARAIRLGDLRAFKVGAGKKLWRLKPCDVDAWIEAAAVPMVVDRTGDGHTQKAATPVPAENGRSSRGE